MDELNPDYIPRYTTRSFSKTKGSSRASTALNIDYNNIDSLCNLASIAYLTSLTTEENNKSSYSKSSNSKSSNSKLTTNKVIIIKPNKVIKEPKSYKEVEATPEWEYWQKAMKNELYSLDENHTWDLVEYSKNSNYSKKPLKSRWVYKLKEYSDNTIEFKARFVAKGFEQLYGIDYIETFASVIKQIAWKLLFALAVLNN